MSLEDRMNDFDFHIVTSIEDERERQLKLNEKIARLAAEAEQDEAVKESNSGG